LRRNIDASARAFAADTSPQLADIRPAIGEFLLRLGI
jgi:hypothetical protein